VSRTPDPDLELLRELRALSERVDPVSAAVTEFAKAALGWRRVDAELAELLSDSALEGLELAGTRAVDGARWLSFRAEELAIEVEVERDGERRTLLGQLEPAPAVADVELQGDDGSVLARSVSDALGRFRIVLERGGRIRLRVLRREAAAAPLETSWLELA
jgi:hypothetical protein